MKKRDINEAKNVTVSWLRAMGHTHAYFMLSLHVSCLFFKAPNACTVNGDELFASTCQQRWGETKRASREVLDMLKTAFRACRPASLAL